VTEPRPPYRLNIGCGKDIRQGWINIDLRQLPGVDLACDLETLRETPIALPDDSVELFLLSHVLEHVQDSLGLMQELWRLALPGARAVVRVPHGASDAAWTDPSHVRPYFHGSFGFFSQPHYWRADYGYTGDWQPEAIQLQVDRRRCAGLDARQIFAKLQAERNLVAEMICELRCVKPRRDTRRDLIVPPRIQLAWAPGTASAAG